MEEISRLLPPKINRALEESSVTVWDKLEEIRLRLNQPVELNYFSKTKWLEQLRFTKQDSMYLINQLSEFSLYRLEDELREGYITVSGGHRVGFSGEVTTKDGNIRQIQQITFFNIRIARELPGVAAPFLHYLNEDGRYLNTLIVGAPKTGKTTFLRDIARLISNGFSENVPQKVSIVDERSELAAAKDGIPQFDVGKRTDVMDACPKVSGLMMMIRSMSPDVIIVDEIGKKEDADAILEAMLAGVTIFCTVHSTSFDSVRKRPIIRDMFQMEIFERVVVLQNERNRFITVHIFTNKGDRLYRDVVKKR